MAKQPLAEVFGFPIDNQSTEAKRCRENALCPFGNVVPNCTKDKANDPLGVCSIYDGSDVVITCPIRFRERWIIAEDAAGFFFPKKTKWTTLTEVRLKDKHGKSAGNIDVVICAYDARGKVTDFGASEVQAVYISGNVRNPFEHYMEDPPKRAKMDWSKHPHYPGPDYLSSSRKRLAPQLLFKGGIFNPRLEQSTSRRGRALWRRRRRAFILRAARAGRNAHVAALPLAVAARQYDCSGITIPCAVGTAVPRLKVT